MYQNNVQYTSISQQFFRLPTKTVLLAAIAICTSGIAQAESASGHSAGSHSEKHVDAHDAFSYDYAELRYINATVDEAGVDLDGDGFEFEASYGLSDKFQVFGLYENIGLDHDIDISEWAIGFGTHLSMVPGTDFAAEMGYISEELREPGHATHSEEGFLLGVSVRKKIGERSELQFAIDYVNFSDAGSRTSFEAVAETHVMPNLAIGAGVNVADEANAWFVEARFYFGGH